MLPSGVTLLPGKPDPTGKMRLGRKGSKVSSSVCPTEKGGELLGGEAVSNVQVHGKGRSEQGELYGRQRDSVDPGMKVGRSLGSKFRWLESRCRRGLRNMALEKLEMSHLELVWSWGQSGRDFLSWN